MTSAADQLALDNLDNLDNLDHLDDLGDLTNLDVHAFDVRAVDHLDVIDDVRSDLLRADDDHDLLAIVRDDLGERRAFDIHDRVHDDITTESTAPTATP